MNTKKLTIRVPAAVLDNAKKFAHDHQTNLTRLITEYLRQLPVEGDPLADAPITKRLTGILSPDVSMDDYYSHLENKYGG